MLINCHYGAYPMHYALCTLFVREVSLGKFTKMCTLPSFSHSLSNLFSFFSWNFPCNNNKKPEQIFHYFKSFCHHEGKNLFWTFLLQIFFSLNLTKSHPSQTPLLVFQQKITKYALKRSFFYLK